MKTILKNIGLISIAMLFNFGYSFSEVSLMGELGVDLTNHTFNTTLKSKNIDLHLNRSQSNHYLKLLASGIIKTEKFATYSLSSEIYGTYLNTESNDSRKSIYLKPTLQSYSAQLSFFPLRPYPFTAFIDKSAKNILRYEQANKSTTNLLSPELAIIRRYETESLTKSVNWNYAISKNTNFVSRYSNTKIKNIRNYDFNENLDLWVIITERFSNPTAPIKVIDIENAVADNTILIYIDNAFIDSIAPGNKIYVNVNEGIRLVEIFSAKYNKFTKQLDVQNDISLKVVYVPPQGSDDSDQSSNDIFTNLNIQRDRFKNDLTFSYSSLDNPIQSLTSSLGNVINKHSFTISRISSLAIETSYNKNETVLDTISSQTSDVFENKTSLTYGRQTGISTAFSHSYSKNNSVINDLKTVNKDQSFSNVISFPLKNYNSLFSLSTSLGSRSNNLGYSNDSYSTALNGVANFELGRLKLTPENKLLLSFSKQKKPDLKSKQIRNKTSLAGNVEELWALGNLDFQGQFEYTKSFNEGFQTINKLLNMDIALTREFSKKYQITIQTTQEKQTTGGSLPTPGANVDQNSPALEAQIISTYRLNLRLKPASSLNMSINISSIKQNMADILSLNLTVFAIVPYLNVPVSSTFMRRSNKMEGLPQQIQLTNENKLRYQFRQVSIEFEHIYTSENLTNENYGYHEFYGKLSRRFGIL